MHFSDFHLRLRVFAPFAGLSLVVVIFALLTWWNGTLEDFLALGNFKLIVAHSSVVAAAGLGMTIIMIAGGIDLSVGYVISLVTVVMMLAFRAVVGSSSPGEAAFWLPGLAALAAGLITGSVCGLANGLAVTKLRVVPFVATLAMLGIARGIGIYLTDGGRLSFPSGYSPALWMRAFGAIEPSSVSPSLGWLIVSPAAWSVVVLGALVAFGLRYTVLGRYCFAIGSNEATARLCGVRVERTKILLYTLAGLLTGWAGVLQFCRTNAGSHDVAAGLELSVIAAVVIGGGSLNGGEGTILGTIIGALIMTVLENGCSRLNLKPDVRYVIIASIILIVAALNSRRQKNRLASSSAEYE
jgi:ribose transport system permease protein